MMKKKIVTLVLSLLLCLGVVPTMTACGKKSDVSILLLANSQENAFYDAHFKQVGSEMGIKIGYIGQASSDYYKALTNEINKGATPDIFYVRPSDIRSYLHDGLIADISEEIANYQAEHADENYSRIYDHAKEMYKYNVSTKTWGEGGTYAIPKDLSVQQLGYNVDLIYRNRQLIYDYYNANATKKATLPKKGGGTVGSGDANTMALPWDMDWATQNYTWTQYKDIAAVLGNSGKTAGGDSVYGCDFPNYEILMWSFGGTLLSADMNTVNVGSAAFEKAGKYIADLVDSGAANYAGASYDKFIGTKDVCFYGLVNSFDVLKFDENLGKFDAAHPENGGWGVMPWPVADPTGDYARVDNTTPAPTAWQGVITSAGYAVSKTCKDKARAVEVIMTLLADDVQTKLLMEEKLQLPLFEDWEADYLKPANDNLYSPPSRSIYIDVISGTNGRISDLYKCYETTWHDKISTALFEYIYPVEKGQGKGLAAWNSHWDATFKSDIQTIYDRNKDK